MVDFVAGGERWVVEGMTAVDGTPVVSEQRMSEK